MYYARLWVIPALFLTAGAGCGTGPVAPVLSDSRVYQNSTEGFRLLIPEGWNQTASSTLPPGKLRGEIFLTRYSLTTPETGASFQVICMAEAESMDLETHHAGDSFGVAKWESSQDRQTIKVDGVPGERFAYTATLDNRGMMKLVTCFRRNDRVYSFVGVGQASDENARQQIERATSDIIWSK